MADASIRDLRNHGGDIVERATRGERVTITRNGKRVAELRSLQPEPMALEAILARWRRLPPVDPARLRAEVDAVLDPRI